MSDPLHNEFAPDSIEAKSLRYLINPNSNLADVKRRGPNVHVRAEGVYLWDNQGKQYIEGLAGLWCTALGYGVKELGEVAKQQIEKLDGFDICSLASPVDPANIDPQGNEHLEEMTSVDQRSH